MAESQHQYVALLRGINVGGHSIVKMAELRKLFESFGLTDVATYIQSGNVLFSAKDDSAERVTQQLEKKLASAFGRQMRVFVLSPAELKQAAGHNPFDPEHMGKEQQCYLMFLSAKPDMMHREAFMARQGEGYQFHIHGKVLYYAYFREDSGSRRTIDFEKVLGVTGTARSWKVVNKLIELSG